MFSYRPASSLQAFLSANYHRYTSFSFTTAYFSDYWYLYIIIASYIWHHYFFNDDDKRFEACFIDITS